MDARDHMLAMNPKLRVVGAHFGSMEDDIDPLFAAHLDRYPNFAVDTASRIPNLEKQPQDKVRAFPFEISGPHYLRHGSGASIREKPERTQPGSLERHYAGDWRYLPRTKRLTFVEKRFKVPEPSVKCWKKIYHDNAAHWIPGVAGSSH